MVSGTLRGRKMALKGQICRATGLTLKEKRKYYDELEKYDVATLRKILKFKRLVK